MAPSPPGRWSARLISRLETRNSRRLTRISRRRSPPPSGGHSSPGKRRRRTRHCERPPGGDVAESAAVTDTHALIFHAAGGGVLGSKAKAAFAEAERGEGIIYVPMAVIWEVS